VGEFSGVRGENRMKGYGIKVDLLIRGKEVRGKESGKKRNMRKKTSEERPPRTIRAHVSERRVVRFVVWGGPSRALQPGRNQGETFGIPTWWGKNIVQ